MDAALYAILQRESKGSTGLENGIAVPHAKCPEVMSLKFIFGISHCGVDFEALDGKPTHLIFMFLAQADKSGPHIEEICEIAKMIKSKALCRMLMECKTTKKVLDLLTG